MNEGVGLDSGVGFLWHSAASDSGLGLVVDPGDCTRFSGRTLIFTFLKVTWSLLISVTHGVSVAQLRTQEYLLPGPGDRT